jgi:hypothetical protein
MAAAAQSFPAGSFDSSPRAFPCGAGGGDAIVLRSPPVTAHSTKKEDRSSRAPVFALISSAATRRDYDWRCTI